MLIVLDKDWLQRLTRKISLIGKDNRLKAMLKTILSESKIKFLIYYMHGVCSIGAITQFSRWFYFIIWFFCFKIENANLGHFCDLKFNIGQHKSFCGVLGKHIWSRKFYLLLNNFILCRLEIFIYSGVSLLL